MGKKGRFARKQRKEEEEGAMKRSQAGSSPAEASSSGAAASFVFGGGAGRQPETAEAEKGSGFTFEVEAPGALNSAAVGPDPTTGMTDAQRASYWYDKCLRAWTETNEAEDSLASLEVQYAVLRQESNRSARSTAATMAAGDSQEELGDLRHTNHQLQGEIKTLNSELERAREEISAVEQDSKTIAKLKEDNKNHRRAAINYEERAKKAEKILEHWETQYLHEHKHLAKVIEPDRWVPPEEPMHARAGDIIIQLRRNVQESTTTNGTLNEELTSVKLHFEEQKTRSQDLQLQKDSLEHELNRREGELQDIIERHGGQRNVGDAIVILAQQVEQAEMDKAAIVQELSNQREELESLRRFKEQQQSTSWTRGHRRQTSSRPSSVNMGNTSLAEEFGSATLSEDGEDSEYQPQQLSMSEIMTQEIVPVEPKPKAAPSPAAFSMSGIMTQEIIPVAPKPKPKPSVAPLSMSSIMTQEIEPIAPAPQKPAEPPRQTLSISPLATQEIIPRKPKAPTLSFSKITSEEIIPRAPEPKQLSSSWIMPEEITSYLPVPQKLSFSEMMTQEIEPRAVISKQLGSSGPPTEQSATALAGRIFRTPPPQPLNTISPIYTVLDIAPSHRRRKPPAGSLATTEHVTHPSTTSEESPAPEIPQITQPLTLFVETKPRSSTAVTIINILLFISLALLARLCASRFVFYREWHTANHIGDWRAVSWRYHPPALPVPIQTFNVNGLHESLWNLLNGIANIMGAPPSWIPALHWRVVEWWSKVGAEVVGLA